MMTPPGTLPSRRVFGRDDDVARVVQMLDPGAPAFVTVTGRGGVGKTALAGEVLRVLGDPDLTTWVSLAGVTEPDLVLSEIATSLGVPLEPGADLTEAVVGVLGHGNRLLVLDNAEHLLEVAPTLGELFVRSGNLRILVTSQAPLRLQVEQVVALSPLPVPVPDDVSTMHVHELMQQPAIAAYCQQAAAVDLQFVLTERNAASVAELVRRLEGLPLAIELAAARAATLPASEIVRRVGDEAALGVLHRRRSDAPARHHGLGEAIQWTYRLLSSSEQRALRRLSATVGTFDLDTAIALIGATAPDERSEMHALDEISALVDFHLLDPLPESDPRRFTMPDSIRTVARAELDRLDESTEADELRIRVRAQQARTVAAGTESGHEESLAARIEADRADLLDALRAATDLGLADEALDIARGLGAHWDLRGYGPVQEAMLDAALALGERSSADPSRLANAMLWSAYLGLRHASSADQEELIGRIHDAERIAHGTGDDAALFHAQCVWMLVVPVTGDLDRAKQAADEGRRLAHRNDNEGWRSVIQVWSAMLAQVLGDEALAIELGTDALTRATRSGDKETILRATMLLGTMTDRFPDGIPDLPSSEEALALARELGLVYYEALLLVRLATESLDDDREVTLRWMTETLEMARTMLGSTMVGFDLMVTTSAAHALGDLDRAAFFHGTVRESFPVLEQFVPEQQRIRHHAMLDDVRAALGPERFEALAARGAALSCGDAVDEAIAYVEAQRTPPVDLTRPVPDGGTPPTDRLTARQVEVLRLLAAGLSNKDIAAELGVRAKTVMHHTTAIYRELGVRGRGEAAALAFRANLVE